MTPPLLPKVLSSLVRCFRWVSNRRNDITSRGERVDLPNHVNLPPVHNHVDQSAIFTPKLGLRGGERPELLRPSYLETGLMRARSGFADRLTRPERVALEHYEELPPVRGVSDEEIEEIRAEARRQENRDGDGDATMEEAGYSAAAADDDDDGYSTDDSMFCESEGPDYWDEDWTRQPARRRRLIHDRLLDDVSGAPGVELQELEDGDEGEGANATTTAAELNQGEEFNGSAPSAEDLSEMQVDEAPRARGG